MFSPDTKCRFKAKKMRDEFLDVVRYYSEDASLIVSAGDSAEDEDQVEGLWDRETNEWISNKLALQKERVKLARSRLDEYVVTGDELAPGHPQWLEYKSLSEDAALASIEYFQAELNCTQSLLKHARIVCVTTDTGLQIVSRTSMLAAHFKGMRFPLGFFDEAHQLDIRPVAAICNSLCTAVFLGDEDQLIDFSKPTDRIVQRAEVLPGEYWSWQRSMPRSAMVPVWSCLGTAPHRMNVTFRFGIFGVQFLNKVVPAYAQSRDNSRKIALPLAPGENSQIPASRLRFVSYRNATVIASKHQGYLDGPELEAPPARSAANPMGNFDPVGCVPLPFWHMLHEGCIFLHALENGKVRLNPNQPPLQLTVTTRVIGSYFYRKHVTVVFRCFAYGMLSRPEILRSYRLSEAFPYYRVWDIAVIDTGSGQTVLLAQGLVVPRVVRFSDLRGNYKDLGRFLVFISRFRLYLSLYICSECFEAEGFRFCEVYMPRIPRKRRSMVSTLRV